jgi:hypothetical protein
MAPTTKVGVAYEVGGLRRRRGVGAWVLRLLYVVYATVRDVCLWGALVATGQPARAPAAVRATADNDLLRRPATELAARVHHARTPKGPVSLPPPSHRQGMGWGVGWVGWVQIRARKLTSRALVDAYIARASAVNPSLNAIVADRFDAARREADAADAAIARGDDLSRRPFHGVPCTIKVGGDPCPPTVHDPRAHPVPVASAAPLAVVVAVAVA